MDQANYQSTETQHTAIREHFLAGRSLTPLEALRAFGCMRLAAVVHRLKVRERMNIVTETCTEDGSERKKRFANYRLAPPEKVEGGHHAD